MSSAVVNSDADLLDLLRVAGPLDVAEMSAAIEVTATAVRQRLTRMMARGLIERESVRAGRGRPRHRYRLTDRGLDLTGSNLPDLAVALWQEIKSLQDEELRRSMLRHVVKAMASGYVGQIKGATPAERLRSLSELLAQRRVPCCVDANAVDGSPVLTTKACPYPKLAEADRSVCHMETLLFSELLGSSVQLSSCRLNGDASCQFKVP